MAAKKGWTTKRKLILEPGMRPTQSLPTPAPVKAGDVPIKIVGPAVKRIGGKINYQKIFK